MTSVADLPPAERKRQREALRRRMQQPGTCEAVFKLDSIQTIFNYLSCLRVLEMLISWASLSFWNKTHIACFPLNQPLDLYMCMCICIYVYIYICANMYICK